MSDLIIARLGQTPADPISWAAFTGAGLDESGRAENVEALFGALDRFGDMARIAAILPGEQAAMRAFPSPPRNPAKFSSAARLLLEDELAQEVDDCHIATLRTEEAGRVFAVDAKVMSQWTALFSEAGLPLHLLTVDFDCLGGEADRPVLFLENDRIIASFGDQAFAGEKSVALALIKSLNSNNPDTDVTIYGGEADGPATGEDPFTRAGPADDVSLMRAAARRIASGGVINLLQGAFKPKRRQVVDVSRWKRPAVAAAALLVAFLAYVAADGVRNQRMADRYGKEAERLHREYFPEAANADPRTHARAVLARGGGASFLALSDALGRAAEEIEGVSIDRLRFDTGRGTLVFSIRSESDAKIEDFRQLLQSYGVAAAETGGYRRAGAFWTGEMTARL